MKKNQILLSAAYIILVNQRTLSKLHEDEFRECELLSLENYQ